MTCWQQCLQQPSGCPYAPGGPGTPSPPCHPSPAPQHPTPYQICSAMLMRRFPHLSKHTRIFMAKHQDTEQEIRCQQQQQQQLSMSAGRRSSYEVEGVEGGRGAGGEERGQGGGGGEGSGGGGRAGHQQYLTTSRKFEDVFGPVRVQQAHLCLHGHLNCRCH